MVEVKTNETLLDKAYEQLPTAKGFSTSISLLHCTQKALNNQSETVHHMGPRLLPLRGIAVITSSYLMQEAFGSIQTAAKTNQIGIAILMGLSFAGNACDLILTAGEIALDMGVNLPVICIKSLPALMNTMLILQVPGIILSAKKVAEAFKAYLEVIDDATLEKAQKEAHLKFKIAELGMTLLFAGSVTTICVASVAFHPIAWGLLAAGTLGSIKLDQMETENLSINS